MKRPVKRTALGLTGALVLGLAACGGNGTNTDYRTADGTVTGNTANNRYNGGGDSLVEDAREALEGTARDARNGLDRATDRVGDALQGNGSDGVRDSDR